MTPEPTRRKFFHQAARTAALSAAVAPWRGVHAFAADSSDRLRLGIVGCGGIMKHHLRGFARRGDRVAIEWLCDVDPRQLEQMAQLVDAHQTSSARRTERFEEVVQDTDVQAVVVATPHHWHTPIALAALQAGKDVYLEKPISHVYDEGNLIIETARRHGRIVQQGTQMRSSPVTERAGRLLSEGVIGDIKVARAWTAELRRPVAPVPDSTPPDGVDYDRWLGPAPARPFNRHRFHTTWRMFRDYGNGEIGDDGIHDLDMAAWGLGVTTLPDEVTARGSRMNPGPHAGEYPDNLHVTYQFADGRLLVYENYPFTSYGLHGFDNGNVFYGTEGYMVFSRRGAFQVYLGAKGKRGPTEGSELRGRRGYDEHMQDFLRAVRTREPVNRAPADVAHRSCALVHLGEIALRTQGRLQFDPQAERFISCDEANAMLNKSYRTPFGLPASV